MIENEEKLARLRYENAIMRNVLHKVADMEKYLCMLPASQEKTIRIHAGLGLAVALSKQVFADLIASED